MQSEPIQTHTVLQLLSAVNMLNTQQLSATKAQRPKLQNKY